MIIKHNKPATHSNLIRIVDVGTGALLLLCTLAELVEEHAVLLASVLHLQDRVDAPSLGTGCKLTFEYYKRTGTDS